MLKCYEVFDKNCDCGQVIVWAENSNKAKIEGMKNDIFDWCEYTEMRANRKPQWDKYSETKRIPIQELLNNCWWFGCAICGKEYLYKEHIDNKQAFIYDKNAEYYGFVKGNLICVNCKEKLEV